MKRLNYQEPEGLNGREVRGSGPEEEVGTRGADSETRRSMGSTECTCFIFGDKEDEKEERSERAARAEEDVKEEDPYEDDRSGKDTFT